MYKYCVVVYRSVHVVVVYYFQKFRSLTPFLKPPPELFRLINNNKLGVEM